MIEGSRRRQFLKNMALAGGMGLLTAGRGWAEVVPSQQEKHPALSPEEKKKLKEELQRELERRVYSVDEELFRKVNRPAHPGQYSGHERSHVPKIIAPKQVQRLQAFPVKVVVGVEDLHEMQVFHYIDWISLSIGAVQVGFASIAPIFCQASVMFELTLERNAILRAQEHCNLHGVWESEPFEIEVV